MRRLSLLERPDGAILAPTSGTKNVGSIRYPGIGRKSAEAACDRCKIGVLFTDPIVGGRGPPRPSPGARGTPRNNISPQCAARRGNDGRFSCQVAKPGRARAVLDAVYSGSRA